MASPEPQSEFSCSRDMWIPLRPTQDLLGLSPKPSGAPGWEGAPLAGYMLELEAEESGGRGVTWRDLGEAASPSYDPREPGILQNQRGGGSSP